MEQAPNQSQPKEQKEKKRLTTFNQCITKCDSLFIELKQKIVRIRNDILHYRYITRQTISKIHYYQDLCSKIIEDIEKLCDDDFEKQDDIKLMESNNLRKPYFIQNNNYKMGYSQGGYLKKIYNFIKKREEKWQPLVSRWSQLHISYYQGLRDKRDDIEEFQKMRHRLLDIEYDRKRFGLEEYPSMKVNFERLKGIFEMYTSVNHKSKLEYLQGLLQWVAQKKQEAQQNQGN